MDKKMGGRGNQMYRASVLKRVLKQYVDNQLKNHFKKEKGQERGVAG